MQATAASQTTIHSNGSGEVEPIEALFAALEAHPLDRTFEPEQFGSFIYSDPVNFAGERLYPDGTVAFFGNFFTLSYVFNITTTDVDLIDRLTAAIRANQQRPDYLAQETYEQQQARRSAEEFARREKRMAQEKQRARSLLGLEAA